MLEQIYSILVKRFEEQRENIQAAFDLIHKKGIHKDVKAFHIEIFISGTLDVILFCCDDDLNDIEDTDSSCFSSQISLIEDMDFEDIEELIYEIEDEDEMDYVDRETENFCLAYTSALIKECMGDIPIDIYVLIHDTGVAVDLKTETLKDIY